MYKTANEVTITCLSTEKELIESVLRSEIRAMKAIGTKRWSEKYTLGDLETVLSIVEREKGEK